MRIAVFSPLNPVKSGISDFTEELVFALRQYMDVDLFVDGYKPSNPRIAEGFAVFRIEEIDKPEVREQYDLMLFEVGNSASRHQKIVQYMLKYNGVMELHDYAMHHYAAETTINKGDEAGYSALMQYCHGERGLRKAEAYLAGLCPPPWEDCPLDYPLNKMMVDYARAVIVHSDYNKQLIKGINPACRIAGIPLHADILTDDAERFRLECRRKLGIDENTLMLASYGFATKPKRILQILEALTELVKRTKDFVYYIVGQLDDDDILSRIQSLGLQKHVVKTGFVDLETLKDYMGAADIALNLRYPTQGESSGSLHRLLGMGKTVLVSEVGAFDEYPNDIVVKIRVDENEVDDIAKSLIALGGDREAFAARGKRVLAYARENFSIDANARRYHEFLLSLFEPKHRETEYGDHLLDRLCEIGLVNRSYVRNVGRRASELMGSL
jgi:glycosyltransferase involved in cell wall biosynthesis